tara:strand:+ start:545 stop:676 length:132 start_codon:yes stop_codon:yes gene_type:complete
MKKKIFVILFIAILLSSCGKKGDPVYNEESKNLKISSTKQIIL